jgi:hypothetical protein
LFEVASTNVLRTFPGDTARTFVSPDARVVAIGVAGEAGKADRVLFQEAETGRKLGAPELERDVKVDWEMASFSPDSRELFLPGRFRDKPCVQVIPVEAGLKRIDELPTGTSGDGRLMMLAAVPGRRAFVAGWHRDRSEEKKPSKISLVDLESRTERVLDAIDLQPFRGIYDPRLWISGDGNYVALSDIMVKDRGSFLVANLRTGAIAMRHSENSVTFPLMCFLPDGKRMIVEWAPHFETMYFNALPTAPQRPIERPVAKLLLYQIATGKKISEYTPPMPTRTLQVSADGKKVAFSWKAEVFVVGFWDAFRMN